MKNVKFKPDGGPITVAVKCGFAQAGSYTVYLWEAHANKIVVKARGNFINPDDDTYRLPAPNVQNDQRIVECIATVVLTPPIKQYDLSLTVSQDGVQLASEASAGQADSPTVTVDLFVQMEAQ